MEKQPEFIPPYISFLISTIKDASLTKRQGYHYKALIDLREAIYPLYPTDDLGENAKLWLKKIEAVEVAADQEAGKGITVYNRVGIRRYYRDRLAANIWNEIMPDLWKFLHDKNYFTNLKGKPPFKKETFFDE